MAHCTPSAPAESLACYVPQDWQDVSCSSVTRYSSRVDVK